MFQIKLNSVNKVIEIYCFTLLKTKKKFFWAIRYFLSTTNTLNRLLKKFLIKTEWN